MGLWVEGPGGGESGKYNRKSYTGGDRKSGRGFELHLKSNEEYLNEGELGESRVTKRVFMSL